MKALAVALAVVVLALGALVFLLVQPLAGRGPRWQGPAADAQVLRENVRNLVALGRRDDEQGMARAASWLSSRLAALGLRQQEQEYRFGSGTYRNLIVRLGPPTQQRLVIGAHYDARGPFAGADDNASGVAGLLELARLLKDRPPQLETELVFYAREEVEGMGSAVHARSLPEGQVRAMVSLEMIGCFSGRQRFPLRALSLLYPAQGDYIVVVGRPRDLTLVRDLKRALAATALRVESINAPEAIRGVGGSDHRNYWRKGIAAAMVTDTAWYRNPRYHTARDTPGTLDYQRMAQVVEGVAAWASAVPR